MENKAKYQAILEYNKKLVWAIEDQLSTAADKGENLRTPELDKELQDMYNQNECIESWISDGEVSGGTVYANNEYLSQSQMEVNARYIYNYLSARGWSKNAICAMLGNMQTESTSNPGIWESCDETNISGGYGLVQWTPSSKYRKWAKNNGYLYPYDINAQLERIIYETEHTEDPEARQWMCSDMSFKEFSKSTKDASELAELFLNYYENPSDKNQPKRAKQARFWYNYFS